MACMMCLRDRPFRFGSSPIGLNTLVAKTTLSRPGPRSFKAARPTTSSLAPTEYMSAVSKKLIPRSSARSDEWPAFLLFEHPFTPFLRPVGHGSKTDPRYLQAG